MDWRTGRSASHDRPYTVACIGDSITCVPRFTGSTGRIRGWVDQLDAALARSRGPRAGHGFVGLWRADEWSRSGQWHRAAVTDPFDVAPFRQGFYSSGLGDDTLTWTKPRDVRVGAFDLYWFGMPAAGDWQYRVDGGEWRSSGACADAGDNELHKVSVSARVRASVEIRGHDGTAPCLAPIAGIATYERRSRRGAYLVHNLGFPRELLSQFCRPTKGDPLALLDDLRPDLVTALFSNDVTMGSVDRYREQLGTLVEHARARGATTLLMSAFEQGSSREACDATTEVGSRVVRTGSPLFGSWDVYAAVNGTNIPPRTTITGVVSPTEAVLNTAATDSCANGHIVVGRRRDAVAQVAYRAAVADVAASTGSLHIDLAEAWTQLAGAGWAAAYEHGLLVDRLHPSQRGHDDIARRVIATLGLE